MKEFKNVHGSMDTVKEVEFNVDTIYVRSNVVRLDDVWQYDEIQYTYQEWAELSHKRTSDFINELDNIKKENEMLKEALMTLAASQDIELLI